MSQVRHDPTGVPPAQFVASVLVEWASERVLRLPVGGPMLRRVFERMLRVPEDERSLRALAEMAQALGAEGYFADRPWQTKSEMTAFVRRVVARLRS